MRAPALQLAAVLLVAVPGVAAAEVAIGVTSVELGGEVPATLDDAIEQAVTAGLEGRGLRVLGVRRLADAMARGAADLAACADEACLEELAERTGVDATVAVSVRGALNIYSFNLRVSSLSGDELAVEDGGCDLCNLAELRAAVEASARHLADTLPRTVAVTLEPSDPAAEVEVDGERAPGLMLALPPGEHHVRARTGDGREAEATVVVRLGEPAQVALDLGSRAGIGPGRSGPGARGLSIAGWVLVAAGAAALVAGVVDIALDGQCYDAPDATGVCPNVFTTLWIGVGLAAGGGALAATGLALVIVGRRRASGERGRAPGFSLAISPAAPAGLSVLGRF